MVYIIGRDDARLDAAVNEVNRLAVGRGLSKKIKLDLKNASDIEQCFNGIINEAGKIDILINCAGGGARGEAKYLHEQTIDTIDEVLNSNLRASILCSRAVIKSMIDQRYGKIVNFSSAIGLNGKEKWCEYSAAKAGILGLTRTLAKEVGKYGVNVNCITPGAIRRGKFSKLEAEYSQNSNYLEMIASVDDIAKVVSFLACDDSKFITGQNIIVDGGRTLGLKGDS